MRHQTGEHVLLVADVGIVWIREAAIGVRLRAVVAEEPNQLPRLARQRPEEQGVDDREHRRVCPNPERKDEDCDE